MGEARHAPFLFVNFCQVGESDEDPRRSPLGSRRIAAIFVAASRCGDFTRLPIKNIEGLFDDPSRTRIDSY